MKNIPMDRIIEAFMNHGYMVSGTAEKVDHTAAVKCTRMDGQGRKNDARAVYGSSWQVRGLYRDS